MKLGATTLPLAGWLADPQQPENSREQRLATIRQLVQGYGLSAVELTLDLAMVFPQVFNEAFYSSVADLQQELDFTCTAHLPFLWVDLASLNEPVRQASVECHHRAIQATTALQVSTYVLHLWGLASVQILMSLEHPAQQQAILGAMTAQAGRSLVTLCEFLEPGDICVENLEAPSFKYSLPLIEQAGTSICLDVGHLAWEGTSASDFMAQHGSRVREIHLHDAKQIPAVPRPLIRDHLALGQGEIDYSAFLQMLEQSEFEGSIILEVNSQADLEESLRRIAPFLRE